MRSVSSLSSFDDTEETKQETQEFSKVPPGTVYQTCVNTLEGSTRRDFVWTDEQSLDGVKGADLWAMAEKNIEFHNISSVLVGLEGTAPQMKSPFGVVHDTSGASAKISALGNRKWSSYRKNHAHQVPSSEGGMRLRIDRSTFQDLQDICESIDLADSSVDISTQQHVFNRDTLARRQAEKILFKELLSGNGREARQALEAARKRYATDSKRPDRVFKAIHAGDTRADGGKNAKAEAGAAGNSLVGVLGLGTSRRTKR
jgi:hypothetical protein